MSQAKAQLVGGVGISTAYHLTIYDGSTNYGGSTISGILTATTSVVGSAVTSNSSGINVTGIITSSTVIVGSAVTINSSGIVVTGLVTATDYNSSSDINLKENIETVQNAVDIVNDLRGVKFEWKSDGRASYGVIAQELESVLPELVSDTDPKTVNYNGIISVLIEAIKELNLKIDNIERNK